MHKKLGIAIFTASILICVALFAWSTQVTVQTPLGAYPGTVSAGDLDITWTQSGTAGMTSGVTFNITGGEILLIHSATASVWSSEAVDDVTFTLQSTADNLGRFGDVDYTLSPGEYAAFNFSGIQGWRVSGVVASVSCATSALEFAVLKYK